MELFAVEIRTSQLREMIRWYENYLRLKVVLRVNEDGYVLLAGQGFRVALLRRTAEALPPPGRISLALEMADLESILHTVREQEPSGDGVPDIETSDEGFEQLILSDPDGNRVLLFRFVEA